MTFDYALLRGRIKDRFGTFGRLAKELRISNGRMSMLLNNKARWDDEMIIRAATLLDITDEITTYFFKLKSQK